MADPEVRLRPRWRWGRMVAGLAAVVAILLAVMWLLDWERRRDLRDAVPGIMAVVDDGLQHCALGARVPDAELGRRVAFAELSGALTADRIEKCSAAMTRGLERFADAFERHHVELSEFRSPVEPSADDPPGDESSAICRHVERVRAIAGRLGTVRPEPGCDPRIETLAPTVEAAEGETISRSTEGDELVLEVSTRRGGEEQHRIRRTRDGVSWTESDPIDTGWEFHTGPHGTFTFAFVSGQKRARYHVLEGERWHVGVPALEGREIAWRPTAAGWTLISRTEAGASVVRLDPRMDRVLSVTPIAALRGRTSWSDPLIGIIDAAGDAALVSIARLEDGVRVETHLAPRQGRPPAPIVTRLPLHADKPEVVACRAAEVKYIVVAGVVLWTSDGGRSLHATTGPRIPAALDIECSERHLWAVGADMTFTTCDRSTCRTSPIPIIPSQPRDLSLAIGLDGERPRLLVTREDRALLYEAGAGAADLALKAIWSWKRGARSPAVRLGTTWFLLRSADLEAAGAY